jgi:hypothetical protein
MITSLILNIDEKHEDFPLYSAFCQKIEIKGRRMLGTECEDVDFHGNFLRLQLAAPEDLKGLVVWIPREHVAFAYAGLEQKKLGF